jgi:hypothetical protein
MPLVRFGSARAGLVCGCLLSGVVLLVVVSWALSHQRFQVSAAALFVAGVTLTATAAFSSGMREERVRRARLPRPVRLPWLVLACALAAGAWVASGTGVYTRWNVVLWISALVTWIVAWWPGESSLPRGVPRPSRATVVSLGAVLSLAVFFRFYLIHDIPGEPTSDHAEKLLDVRDVIRGYHPIYFARNGGREPAQFYVSAAMVKWLGFGLSWQTLKIGTAAVGVVAVLAVYLLGRELGGPAVAVTAATIAAVSRWPVADDRHGLRFPYAILASALILLVLLRYLRLRRRTEALAAGVLLGLGLHGYATFRVWLVGAAGFFLVAAVGGLREGDWHVPLLDGLLAYVTAFVAAIPFVHYSVQHPDLVFTRMTDRLAGGGDESTLRLFLHNTWNGLLAFNWRGDVGWPVSVPYRPFLEPVTGALLLAGMAILFVLVARRALVGVALLITSQVLLLSSTLNFGFPIENPSANRLSVGVPFVAVVAALPVAVGFTSLSALCARLVDGRRYAVAAVGVAVAVCALAAIVWLNYTSFFDDYRRSYLVSSENTSEVAAAIKQERAPLARTFMLGYAQWLDGRNLAIALGDFDWYVDHAIPQGSTIPAPRPGAKIVYALALGDTGDLDGLERRYPAGTARLVKSTRPSHDFVLFVVPAGSTAA